MKRCTLKGKEANDRDYDSIYRAGGTATAMAVASLYTTCQNMANGFIP